MTQKSFRLKVLFMDEPTFDIWDEQGTAGVHKEYEKDNATYELIDKTFNTETERQAYIQALYDMSMGCWSHYAVLDNRCRNF